MSKYMKELFTILSTKQNLSITYHPQTDGQTQQMNQNIEQYLCGFINYHQDDWKEWLFTAEFSYINFVHAAMQQTPFFLKYGQYPWTGENTRREVRNESAAEFADHMEKARLDEKENTGKSFILFSISPYKAARYRNQQKPPSLPPVEIKEEQEYHVEPSLTRRKIAIFGTLERISTRRRYSGTCQTSQTCSRTHHTVSCIQSKTPRPYQEFQSLLQGR